MQKELEGAKKSAESAPKGIRFLVRVWGFVAALCMASTGLFVMITVHSLCLVGGIIQITVSLLVLTLEAPILCSSFELAIKIGDFFDRYFKFWMRALFYLVCAIPPPYFCFELSTFIGSGTLFVLAALYGMLAIGKKGGAVEETSKKQFSNSSNDVEMKTRLMTSTGEPNELNTY